MLAHVQLLVDDGYSQLLGRFRGEIPYAFAENPDLSLVSCVDAAEDFHKGGFACAVLSQKGHDFSALQIKLYLVKRQHTRKRFCYVL